MLDKGAHDGGRAFGPHGEALVGKGVHLLFHHIGGFANGADKEFGLFEDGRADFAHAETSAHFGGAGLKPLPEVNLFGQNILKAVDGLQFCHGCRWW